MRFRIQDRPSEYSSNLYTTPKSKVTLVVVEELDDEVLNESIVPINIGRGVMLVMGGWLGVTTSDSRLHQQTAEFSHETCSHRSHCSDM